MSGFKIISLFIQVDQNVYKFKPPTRAPRYILIKSFSLYSNRLKLSSWSFTHVLNKFRLLWGCISKPFSFQQITAEHQDCPLFTVFLTLKSKIGNDLVVDIRCIDPEKPHPASLILSTIVPITPGFVIHWSENKTWTVPLFFYTRWLPSCHKKTNGETLHLIIDLIFFRFRKERVSNSTWKSTFKIAVFW